MREGSYSIKCASSRGKFILWVSARMGLMVRTGSRLARRSPVGLLTGCLMILWSVSVHGASIVGSKHDLSATTGPGPIKAVSERRVCVFCHTPHGATMEHASEPGLRFPLWNHELQAPSVTYIVPSAFQGIPLLSTPQAVPDGESRLCLSCHDGTVAVGAVVNIGGGPGVVAMAGIGQGLTPEGKMDPSFSSFGGTDLSGHHPVSIAVTSQLVNDRDLNCQGFRVRLNPTPPVQYRPTLNQYSGQGGDGVQCTSCHDPHDDRGGDFMFLRLGTPFVNTDPLCLSCHELCP